MKYVVIVQTFRSVSRSFPKFDRSTLLSIINAAKHQSASQLPLRGVLHSDVS